MRILLVLFIFFILSFLPVNHSKADLNQDQDIEVQIYPVTVVLEPKGDTRPQTMVFIAPFRSSINKVIYYDKLMTETGWYVERHKDGKIICSIAQCCGDKPKKVAMSQLPEHARKMVEKLSKSTKKNFYIICEPAYIQIATTDGMNKDSWKQIGEIFLNDLLAKYPETTISSSELNFNLPLQSAKNK